MDLIVRTKLLNRLQHPKSRVNAPDDVSQTSKRSPARLLIPMGNRGLSPIIRSMNRGLSPIYGTLISGRIEPPIVTRSLAENRGLSPIYSIFILW